MIYTVTANPALDVGGMVSEIRPDDKTYVYDETRNPGGNGINVARVLTRLKIACEATGFIGGSTGEELCELLTSEGVPHNFVWIRGHTRMGVTVTSAKTGRQTRLSFPGPHIDQAEAAMLSARIAALKDMEMLVFGGSYPPGFDLAAAAHLVRQASDRGIPVFADVPAEQLGPLLETGTLTLIKPNLSEFESLLGREVPPEPLAVTLAARALTDRVPLVCVSSVGKATVLVSKKGAWLASGPHVEVRSAVGAGDSLVAGMTAQFYESRAHDTAQDEDSLARGMLRLGMACALATVETPGTMPGSLSDIRQFLEQITVTTVA